MMNLKSFSNYLSIIILSTFMFMITFLLTSCDISLKKVTFIINEDVHAKVEIINNTVNLPKVSIGEGCVHIGWFTDKQLANKFDHNNVEDIRQVFSKIYCLHYSEGNCEVSEMLNINLKLDGMKHFEEIKIEVTQYTITFKELLDKILASEEIVLNSKYNYTLFWYLNGQRIVSKNQVFSIHELRTTLNIVGEFVLNQDEKNMIIIYSASDIFNGTNMILFDELKNQLVIRDFLLELRNAMNGLNGNTTRTFLDITFKITPGMELVGFYLLENKGTNILHTNDNLEFDTNNQFVAYAIVRTYTHRNTLIFLDYANGYEIAIPSGVHRIVYLPSFHNGKKITSIAANGFSGRSINLLQLPLYIIQIGENAFANNTIAMEEISFANMPYLEKIKSRAFANMSWVARRNVYINTITSQLKYISPLAFENVANINVVMLGNWTTQPLWWSMRANFNAGNRFINDANVNISDHISNL